MGFFGKKVVIPAPSGAHAIGLCAFDVAAPPGALGQAVPVLAWYPAMPSEAQPEPALDEALRDALSGMTRVPKLMLRPGQSHAVLDGPPAKGRFPVLLFNHGLGSFQKQSGSLMQELASHGFVVLSVGHPSESLVVRHRDGALVRWRRDLPAWAALEQGMKDLEGALREASPAITRARQCRDARSLREAMEAVAKLPGYAALPEVIARWAADTRAVIDHLPQLDEGVLAPPLRGLVDPAQVGAFGHSLGGMVSAHLAMTEPRVRAGMNFDGAQLPVPGAPYALRAPFCFVYADMAKVGATSLANEGMNDGLLADAPPGSCGVCIAGAAHLNFTDMNNVAMMARALGPIDRAEMARTLRALTVGFFAHHLAGKPLTGFTSPVLRFTRPVS
ncbi:MAG: alpha/beta hydrolase family protein [Myxococcota bacterium]